MRCCSSLTSTALSNEAPAQPAWAEARYDCVAAAGADPPATFPLSEGRSARSIQPQPQPTCGGSVVPLVWSHSHLPAMRVATLPQAHRLAPDGGEHVAHHAEHWCFLADRGCPWCHGSSAFRSHELLLVVRTTETQIPCRVLNGLVERHLIKSKAGRAPSLEGAMRSLLSSVDHKESRRLFRKSHHIPFVTILAACWIVAAVLSAALTILAEGPHNFVP